MLSHLNHASSSPVCFWSSHRDLGAFQDGGGQLLTDNTLGEEYRSWGQALNSEVTSAYGLS
jgi:hypothetical protein